MLIALTYPDNQIFAASLRANLYHAGRTSFVRSSRSKERFFMKRVLALLALLVLAVPLAAENKRPMTVDDLFKFKRVADPQISPDGKQVVYVVTTVTDVSKNQTVANLWVAATDGKTPPRQLTSTTKKDRSPRWSPDGRWIVFESTRSGSEQLWVIDMYGGEARQLTDIATDAGTPIWSRDGKAIAFVSAVYPEFSTKPYKESNEANKKKLDEIASSPVKARTYTRLFYRHWDSFVEDKRQHLFVISFDNGKAGEPRDVTPGDRDAYPTSTTFSVGNDFTFSPDGKYLVFTAVPEKNEAWSTNYDICRVPVTGGSEKWECLTASNPAADTTPQFSPDGKYLAYRAQKKPGYEADKWDMYVVECDNSGSPRGTPRNLTASLDRSAEEFVWWDDKSVSFLAEENARHVFFRISLEPDAKPRPWTNDLLSGSYASFTVSRTDQGIMRCYTCAKLSRPAEVMVDVPEGSSEKTARNLSKANEQLLAELEFAKPESVTVKGANGDPMQMWIIKPPQFDPNKKWPLAYLVHGGPQGAWMDGWSFRWCPQVWAAQGYVVALPNPRGSTGFGQKYCDEITGDWGGKCYEDLMKGVDYLESLPYIDKDRKFAAGASFGGYMMNWFQGQTTRFKTLVTHCSVYNFETMYMTTDELWFDEWEHQGPPWGPTRESYEKHSPHKYAKNFKTPMLIIHNDLDFRCPVSEGHQLFTTLQRLGIPSKFINFPDEGHWVLKPANSRHWHNEIYAWLKQYCPPGGK